MKNKTISFKEWPSKGCLDFHLAKSLTLPKNQKWLSFLVPFKKWLCFRY